MKYLNKILYITLPILIGGVLLLSCSNREEIDRNKGEILSVLINRTGIRFTKSGRKSGVPTGVLIYHKNQFDFDDFLESGTPCEHRPLREELLKNFGKDQLFDLDLKHLKLDPNIKVMVSNDSIIKAMDRKISNLKKTLGIDVILSFSEVAVNKEMDLAIVGFGEYWGSMEGGSSIYFFRKIGVTWTIIDEHGIDIL